MWPGWKSWDKPAKSKQNVCVCGVGDNFRLRVTVFNLSEVKLHVIKTLAKSLFFRSRPRSRTHQLGPSKLNEIASSVEIQGVPFIETSSQ